ncbi:MAG: phosphopantetheine-binding protein [Thiobacillus sp.]
MDTLSLTRDILRDNLQLGARADKLEPDSYLMGQLPEFNSLSVVGIIASIEDQLGVAISDDEITGDIFETVGSLAQFIEAKMA